MTVIIAVVAGIAAAVCLCAVGIWRYMRSRAKGNGMKTRQTSEEVKI